MKRIFAISLSLLMIGFILTSISASDEMDEHEKWCFAHYEDDELEDCLNESDSVPRTRAGCLFCEH